MDNVKFSKWLSGLVDHMGDIKLTDCQRSVVTDTMLDMLKGSVVDSDNVPLTLGEVKEIGLDYYVHEEGVYEYKTAHGYTLVQNGKILCKDVKNCWRYECDIYKFKTEDGWTLMKDGDILCKDVEHCHWWSDNGRYEYRTHDCERFIKKI